MNLIQIRQAEIADLKTIQTLLNQLGYSATPEQLQKYLGKRRRPTMKP